MSRYASGTEVSAERSRMEIEQTLRRYKCAEFGYMTRQRSASIGFRMNNLSIRFTLPLPDPDDKAFKLSKNIPPRPRSPQAAFEAWEQACRQRWRALALAIKAKLEAVECGITTFEEEFMAHVVTETGETIGERMMPHLAEIAKGSVPLLPPPRA